MIVRNNLELLTKESIEFNGYTDDTMAIEIMSKSGIQLIAKNFSSYDLNIEKQLIIKERLIYPEIDKKSNQILGIEVWLMHCAKYPTYALIIFNNISIYQKNINPSIFHANTFICFNAYLFYMELYVFRLLYICYNISD